MTRGTQLVVLGPDGPGGRLQQGEAFLDRGGGPGGKGLAGGLGGGSASATEASGAWPTTCSVAGLMMS